MTKTRDTSPGRIVTRRALRERQWRLISLLAASLACARAKERPKADPATQPAEPATAAPSPVPSRIRVPEGHFSMGTAPGRWDRDPETEPRLQRMGLGGFEIDSDVVRAPFDGQPLLLTRAAAREACGQRQGRLCTELEWERACKGPDNHTFAGTESYDPECRSGCASGFGVLGLGSRPEWTASEFPGEQGSRSVVRGARPEEPPSHHRCAHRAAASSADQALSFRCCYGPANAARLPEPRLGSTFGKAELPLPALSELLAKHEATRALSKDLAYFEEPQAAAEVLAKGPGDTKGFLLTVAPLTWNPVPGAELLVVTARSGPDTSFVAVFHALGDGGYDLASSFVMQGEPGPVALGYNGYIRPRLHFSSCWGCPGETGKILYRDPDQAIILQP